MTIEEKIKNIVHKLMLTYAIAPWIKLCFVHGHYPPNISKAYIWEETKKTISYVVGNNIISTAFTTIIMDYF